MKHKVFRTNDDEVSKLSRPRTKVSSFGNGVEDAPSSIATAERSSVSAPLDLDALLLQRKEYHKCGNGDGTRERGSRDAEREQEVRRTGKDERAGSTY